MAHNEKWVLIELDALDPSLEQQGLDAPQRSVGQCEGQIQQAQGQMRRPDSPTVRGQDTQQSKEIRSRPKSGLIPLRSREIFVALRRHAKLATKLRFCVIFPGSNDLPAAFPDRNPQ
jgi:hypothetical protein